MPDFNNMTGLGGYFSPEQLQEQQYGGGLFNPFYGQLAQSMYHGPSPAPADMGGGQPHVSGWSDMGGGLPNPSGQQSFNSPQFWQSILASIGQPQNQPSPFVPPTYEEMVAQANPGGRPVTPLPTPSTPMPPALIPSVTQAAPPGSNTGDSSGNFPGGSTGGFGSTNNATYDANAEAATAANNGMSDTGVATEAHGGRILPKHHYGRAYNDHIHALQISADAAPPYENPTAAAGRRFQPS